MFLELIAAIVAAIAGAGLALLASRLSGGRLPRWIVPLAAGAAMFGYAVWSEYTWFGRTTSDLPEGLAVVDSTRSTAVFRPWTYLVPLTDAFSALDTATIRTNPAAPDQRIADLYRFARWARPARLTVVIDCAAARVAPEPTATYSEDGAVAAAAWETRPPADPLIAAACQEV